MFDSHAHLQDARIADPEGMWQRAQQSGVSELLLAGVDAQDWRAQEQLAHLTQVYFSAGLHPQRVAEMTPDAMERELGLLQAWWQTRSGPQSRWRALGEIGLDGVGQRRASYPLQHAAFEHQLRLARALDVPVILHILRAHEEALLVLRRVGLPRAGGVVHSYSGSAELVPRYLDLGLYLSFGGSITWGEASRAQRALQACPLERMLIETDAPDQTALEHRPAQNEPAFLGAVVQRAASLLGRAPALVVERTRDNARELLRLSGDK